MDVVRPRWSSSSFLLYLGAFVLLVATLALLGWLSGDYGDGAFFGWSLLVFVPFAAVAAALDRAGERVAAGLFGFVAVDLLIVCVTAFFLLINLLGGEEDPIAGFDIGRLLLYLTVLVIALAAIARYRFPLLALVATVAGWLFVVDLVSGGGDWSAVVAILLGLFLVGIGTAVEEPYGFWVHFVAGVSIAGAFLFLWHTSNWEWILIAIVAVFLLLFAAGLARSSYAVLAAILLLFAWSHFVDNWLGPSSLSEYGDPFGREEGAYYGEGGELWEYALLYAVYGLALVAIGLWLDRRRRTSEHLADPSAD